MSIYPVPLAKWYPPGTDNGETAAMILKYNHCTNCGKKPIPYKHAIADHSLPWWYYRDIFCSKKCQKEYRDLVET